MRRSRKKTYTHTHSAPKDKSWSQKECIGDKDWSLLVDISAKRLDPADNLNARMGQEERQNLIRSTVATIIRTWPQLNSTQLSSARLSSTPLLCFCFALWQMSLMPLDESVRN